MTSLCKAVVDVTHDLGRDTVVEGIETKDQLASCVDMGVTFGQGHLLGKLHDRHSARNDPAAERRTQRVGLTRGNDAP